VERLHKTVNEKIRIINTDRNLENKQTRIETILFIYNHKTKNTATGWTSASILPYENKINKLHNNRQNYKIDTKFRKAPLTRSKSKNLFKRTGNIQKLDKNHYNEKNRGQNVVYYRSKFKKKK